MVSILPSQRSPWEVISNQVGQGLSQTLPSAVQQGYQRGMGLSAIDQLQNDISQANGDISKMLPAIAKAYTLNPALERSGIAEKLIPLAQRNQATKEGNFGGFPSRQEEGSQASKPISVTDLVQPREGIVQNPQGLNEFQLPYGPESISKLRQQARQLGYLPEIEERLVNDAKEYNQIAEQRRNAELAGYQQQQQERRDTLENQNQFEKYISSHSPEFAENPDELELALKASEKYQNVPSFAERNAKVKEELRPYQAAKKGLENVLKRPLTGYTPEQLDLARKRAKFMVDMGQKPQLQLMIANGGQGQVEEAMLLNPLPNELNNHLSSVKKFVNPLEKVNTTDPDSPEYARQLSRGSDLRFKQKENMTNYLSKEIKPGKDFNNPGTNLLLLRKHLMDKGMEWQEAGLTLDDAIEKGHIKLDPQQQIDYQRLGVPPLTGEDYTDTVLNNILFPLTGKE